VKSEHRMPHHAIVRDLLQENLDEEKAADKRLTSLAESRVSRAAA
jgi:ferritin-like metal-binding protein YciE